MRALVAHYTAMVADFQRSDWARGIGNSGKFVEAVLKALSVHVGKPLPPARQFKVSAVIRDLKQLPVGTTNDAIRITIPRAAEFIYDIASNRGARHDPEEVDPNELDAHVVNSTCSWVLAELLRYSQKGAVSQAETKDLIASLIQRRYPAIEEIDGRTYFHIPNLSARQVAILALWYRHPARLSKLELMMVLSRHHISRTNAMTALSRISTLVDSDHDGRLRLLQPGLKEAEELIRKHSH